MSLHDIITNERYPFENFMDDDLSFLLLEKFWIEVFKECAKGRSEVRNWKPFQAPDRDANPILALVNDAEKKALFIKSIINEDNLPYPAWCMDNTLSLAAADPEREDEYIEGIRIERQYFFPIGWYTDHMTNMYNDFSYDRFTVLSETSLTSLKVSEILIKLFLVNEYINFKILSEKLSERMFDIINAEGFQSFKVPDVFEDIIEGHPGEECLADLCALFNG